MNTTLKPRMNPIEFTHHPPHELALRRLSARPAPAPEIIETYPGTSGSTQGDRNEIRPAKNAAIGNGRLDMRLLLYLLGC